MKYQTSVRLKETGRLRVPVDFWQEKLMTVLPQPESPDYFSIRYNESLVRTIK